MCSKLVYGYICIYIGGSAEFSGSKLIFLRYFMNFETIRRTVSESFVVCI